MTFFEAMTLPIGHPCYCMSLICMPSLIYLPSLPVTIIHPVIVMLALLHIFLNFRSSALWSLGLTMDRHSGALPSTLRSSQLIDRLLRVFNYFHSLHKWPSLWCIINVLRVSLYPQLQCMPASPLTQPHLGCKHTRRSLSPTMFIGQATKQSAFWIWETFSWT